MQKKNIKDDLCHVTISVSSASRSLRWILWRHFQQAMNNAVKFV